MEYDLESMTKEELIELKEKTLKKYNDFNQDIVYTRNAMEDKNVDHVTRKEFENDITYDKMQANSCEILLTKITKELVRR